MSDRNPSSLKWIEEKEDEVKPEIHPPIRISRPQFEYERPRERSKLKLIMDRVVVPLGLLATVGCLGLGLHSLVTGNSHRQQFFMKGRVFFQGFSLVAMTIGAYVSTRSRDEKQNIASNQKLLEKSRL